MRFMVAGTVLAAALAVERGWAINLGGGMHHAYFEVLSPLVRLLAFIFWRSSDAMSGHIAPFNILDQTMCSATML